MQWGGGGKGPENDVIMADSSPERGEKGLFLEYFRLNRLICQGAGVLAMLDYEYITLKGGRGYGAEIVIRKGRRGGGRGWGKGRKL